MGGEIACQALGYPWTSARSPKPPRHPAKRQISVVKRPRAALRRLSGPLGARTPDLNFLNPLQNRLSGYTSSPRLCPSARHNRLFRPNPRCRAYPPTNGIAGGKLPRGKPGRGSPLLSFSAAAR